MRCLNCGSENPPADRYCGQCGARLPEPSQEELDRAEAQRMLQEANLRRVRRQPKAAEALCREALRKYPNEVGCCLLLADILWESDRRDEARSILSQAAAAAPQAAGVQRRMRDWSEEAPAPSPGLWPAVRAFFTHKGDRWYRCGWFRIVLAGLALPITAFWAVVTIWTGPWTLAYLAMAFIAAWYVYNDCGGGTTGVFWAILVFFTFPVGVIVYWILKP